MASVLRRLPRLLSRLREHDVQVVNFHFPRLNVYPLALLKRFGLWRGRIVLSAGNEAAASRLRNQGADVVLLPFEDAASFAVEKLARL